MERESTSTSAHEWVTGPGAIRVLAVVSFTWIALTAGDWFMRFRWFRWQDSVLVSAAQREVGPFEPMLVTTNPPVQGGDLTTLLGSAKGAAEFKEWKPAATNQTDEFGFRNTPPTTGVDYPVVVVGDSFIVTGPRVEDTLPGQLSRELGLPVYNYGYDGRGPFWGIVRFLFAADRFQGREPEVIVWGLLERDISGAAFADAADQIARFQGGGLARLGVDLKALSPIALKKSMPDTSAMALIATRMWNRIRAVLPSDARPVSIAADGLVEGKRILFYVPGMEAMKSPASVRDVQTVTESVALFDALCRDRGIRLVVMLIPDKEQVYREHLPAAFGGPDAVPESVLNDLDVALRAVGIPTVNLLPDFRKESAQDHLIYWTDDTHWNTEGIHLAVRALLPEVRRQMTAREN